LNQSHENESAVRVGDDNAVASRVGVFLSGNGSGSMGIKDLRIFYTIQSIHENLYTNRERLWEGRIP